MYAKQVGNALQLVLPNFHPYLPAGKAIKLSEADIWVLSNQVG